eukprot:g2884.t1
MSLKRAESDRRRVERERAEKEESTFKGKRIPCPALDILRSVRSAFPPTDDVLAEARERDRQRTATPPDEWKKSSRIFQSPFEIELANFYASQRKHWEARYFYQRAETLLVDVFGENSTRVANVRVRLSKSLRQLGWIRRAVSVASSAVRALRNCSDVSEDSTDMRSAVEVLCDALVRVRAYDDAHGEWKQYRERVLSIHKRAMSESNTNVTLRCLEHLRTSEIPLKATACLGESARMRSFDDRTFCEERNRMHDHDARMTPDQQQIMSALKILRDSDGFEAMEVFATRSEGHFRMLFWKEVQEFKTLRSGTQDFAEKIRHIYETYVVPRATLPVIPNEMRKDIHDALDIDSDVKITRHIFDKAEKLILSNIAFETLPNFVETEEGRTFVVDHDLCIPLKPRRRGQKKAAPVGQEPPLLRTRTADEDDEEGEYESTTTDTDDEDEDETDVDEED